ncbi:hypothetical protein [Chryseobacterium sp. R2A-55]|uniref:hypothetical protein n=1 Tax=Chryseobacterium sp. R2A-55 TaxID=2744445 RepID=UPI001F22EA78|nr:hypothetical protein [Chryseobacterium sp. R2A-55]
MDGDIDIRFATINARFYIKKTNETDENTYHLVDTLGEVYNLPAFPAEFVLIDIAGTEYLSLNGDELIINSKKLKPLRDSYDDVKANVDASNIDPHLEIWKAKINGDKVLTIGTITATTDHVNLAVHPSGENTVAIGGKVWKKFVADSFPFTPVAAGETKMLIIFAMGDSQIFYLTEDYTLPDGALVVASITVSDSGVSVDDIAGYKPVGEDNWRTVQLDSTAAKIISMGITPASSFDIVPSAIGTKIGGIGSKMGMFLWDGKEFWFRNFSDFNVTLEPTSIEDTYNFKATTFAETYVLKKNSWAKFKIKEKKLILVEFGGSANFPEDAINGQVLEADSSANGGVKWGTKLKGVADKMLHYWDAGGNWVSSGVEFAGNAILKLKIITFGGYTIAQKNAIASPVEGMLIYQNENPKGFQKYENGAWTAVGSNLSNTDLSNVSARIFTQGNTFTWNTAGFSYQLKNLLNKSTDGGSNRYLSYNPTTGDVGFREFASVRTGIFNPPTLAQLSALGIISGEFYKCTTTGQISIFNGEQLDNWYATASEWNALSMEQKNAVKNFHIL